MWERGIDKGERVEDIMMVLVFIYIYIYMRYGYQAELGLIVFRRRAL